MSYKEKITTAAEAVKLVKSGDRVYIGTSSSFAYELIDALFDRRDELEDVTLLCSMSIMPCRMFDTDWSGYTKAGRKPPFSVETFFLGTGEKKAFRKNGMPLKYTSIHLSLIEDWVKNIGKPDICFLQVSRPDKDGNLSFGSAGTCDVSCFVENCKRDIILEANTGTPFIFGEKNMIHFSEVSAIIETDKPAPCLPDTPPDETALQVAKHVVAEIPDGATIQLGIGKMGTAVGELLKTKNDLGIFTEMFTTSMYYLIKNGNVTNKYKGYYDGLSVLGFSAGTQEMYDFMNYNPTIYGAPWTLVNNPVEIAKNKKMMSVNAAMAIDVFGQVAAEAMGYQQQSGCGGQVDYVKGSQMSEGGKSFIAMTSSMVKNGERKSKIVLGLPVGTAVTTPRCEVQYVATEYGCVNLKNLTMQDRVRAMIGLAHPDFRDEMTQQAKEYGLI